MSPVPSGAWPPKGLLGAVLTGLMVLLVLARLAQRARRGAEYSAGACGRGGRPVADRPDDQPDDAGRPGPGGRHPGGRGHGRGREHPHADASTRPTIARAVRLGNAQTAVPRLLAMLCILAVFIPSFFMEGAARAMFVPLSLAVGFAMIASYILSSTFVPVLSVWLLRHVHSTQGRHRRSRSPGRFRSGCWPRLLGPRRWRRGAWLLGFAGWRSLAGRRPAGHGDFSERRRRPIPLAPPRTRRHALRANRAVALEVLEIDQAKSGRDNVELTLGYVGTIPSSYPINAVYQWIARPGRGDPSQWPSSRTAAFASSSSRTTAPANWQRAMPEVRSSFEPADIINEVMSFGSPTPIEVAVSGPKLAESRSIAETLRTELRKIFRCATCSSPSRWTIRRSTSDRPREGRPERRHPDRRGPVAGRGHFVSAASSCRTTGPIRRPASATRCRCRFRKRTTKSMHDLEPVPAERKVGKASCWCATWPGQPGTMPGQFDRYNMKRQDQPHGQHPRRRPGPCRPAGVAAIERAGKPPRGRRSKSAARSCRCGRCFVGLATWSGSGGRRHFPAADREFPIVAVGLGDLSAPCRP